MINWLAKLPRHRRVDFGYWIVNTLFIAVLLLFALRGFV